VVERAKGRSIKGKRAQELIDPPIPLKVDIAGEGDQITKEVRSHDHDGSLRSLA
jgi:hypothetical protein